MSWLPIDTAPDGERVLVCGWVPQTAAIRGYWWYDLDVTYNGRGVDFPDALFWKKHNAEPFPEPPK